MKLSEVIGTPKSRKADPRPLYVPDGLEFTAEPHSYAFRGKPVPSVSQILKDMGLDRTEDIPDPILEQASKRGNYLHRLFPRLLELRGATPLERVPEELRCQARGILDVILEHDIQPIDCEAIVYSASLRVAGRVDLWCRIGGQVRGSVVDLKTGARVSRGYVALQCCGYSVCIDDMIGPGPQGRYCLRAPKKGKAHLVELKGEFDMQDFENVARTWHRRNGASEQWETI